MKEIEERIKWIRPKKATIPVARLARSILRSRGIDTKSDLSWLEPDYRSLGDPFDLPDMKQAVEHLVATRKDNKKVAVYGDYDIDGLTATTLLTEALRACGFQVISYIPDRFIEGYGLHSQALLDLRSQGVDTVITVDCGITAVEAIADAVAAGLNIIVTDHHSLAESEPVGAVALINPLRANNSYPQTNLAGVGVAFNLVRALQTEFSDELPPGQEKWLLDLVALGTICDIVPLVGENRILAHFGLKVARQSRRPGFQALADVSNAELGRINAKDFGFRFGPRLNAAGRLEHAQAGLDVLSSENYSQAFASAQKLQNLNLARRELTESICEQARQQARAMSEVNFLVLADAAWSHGVAGLVASRIAEEFSKPTIIMQIEGETAKGSGRSIGAIPLIDALRSQSAILIRYGGHAAAAGLTIETSKIDELRSGLHVYAEKNLSAEDYTTSIAADAWLLPDYISEEGLDQLSLLEPFGQSNPVPIFYLTAMIKDIRPVGKDGAHAQIWLQVDQEPAFKLIAFSYHRRWPWLTIGETVEAMVRLSENIWQNRRQPELELVDIRSQV